MTQIQTNTGVENKPEVQSNLSQSAQECMKRLPALTEALRQSQLVSQINDIMRKNPGLTYSNIIDSILQFDQVNQDCITKVRVVGDAKGETILSNYGRKCAAAIKTAGTYCKPAENFEEQGNYMVQITGVTPGSQFALESKVSEVTNYQIPEVKMLLKSLPAVIDVGLKKEEADALAAELQAAGAQVSSEQRQI